MEISEEILGIMEGAKSMPHEEKDPMRDSLMSNSDNDDDDDDEDEEKDNNIQDSNANFDDEGNRLPSEASGANSLDLEFDLWQGQFDFSATNAYYDSVFAYGATATRNGLPLYKDLIKTVSFSQNFHSPPSG